MKNSKQNQNKRFFSFIASAYMIAVISAVFFYEWITYYNLDIVLPYHYKGHWVIMGVYIAELMIFFSVYGGLKFGYLKASSSMLSHLLAVFCTNMLMFLQISMLSAKIAQIEPFINMNLADFAIIIVSAFAIEALHSKLFPPHDVFIVYDEYKPNAMMTKLRYRDDKFNIELVKNVNEISWEEFKEHANKYGTVLIYDIHSELRNKILKYCYAQDIRIYATTKISDILLKGADDIHIFDTPILLIRNSGLTLWERIIKRLMDITFSIIVLIIFSPVMLITAIAIKAYDGGPVLFRQERYTIGGRIFRIHKFRSMIVDAESDGRVIPTSDKDPRITPIGDFIRKTRIDELPQMIDILKGDMSLVGPRPERVEHVEKYTEAISEFDLRLKVKGGLTGYAQIYGKYNTTAYDKIKLDLMYIQNYSILLDIKMLFLTLKVVFMKESTEGFSEEQKIKITADMKQNSMNNNIEE
ncbi:MAG: sugar transferase [Peptostreptococcaceae bacterium]|nr:sugar transferase [Peptostreptococcaceae bacterium]MDY5739697.1 sugar transferase [Anaerovoracaceae bacterium]